MNKKGSPLCGFDILSIYNEEKVLNCLFLKLFKVHHYKSPKNKNMNSIFFFIEREEKVNKYNMQKKHKNNQRF